jgi:hypothetical protein
MASKDSNDGNDSKNAKAGGTYTYEHPTGAGFGEHHKMQSGFGEMTAEMTELDLKSGSEVTLLGTDEDSGWPIVEWTDGNGINRITTVDQATFDEFFTPSSNKE